MQSCFFPSADLAYSAIKRKKSCRTRTEFSPYVFEETRSYFHDKLLCTGCAKLQVTSLVCWAVITLLCTALQNVIGINSQALKYATQLVLFVMRPLLMRGEIVGCSRRVCIVAFVFLTVTSSARGVPSLVPSIFRPKTLEMGKAIFC